MSREILMVNYAGTAGAEMLLKANREELEKRFSKAYLKGFSRAAESAALMREKALACIFGSGSDREGERLFSPLWVKTLDGSIFQGLWALSSDFGTGFRVEFQAIPILQETVEICNALEEDPYEISSEGCILLVTENGAEWKARFDAEGIPSARIGYLTNDRKKVLLRGEEERFLNRPRKCKNSAE